MKKSAITSRAQRRAPTRLAFFTALAAGIAVVVWSQFGVGYGSAEHPALPLGGRAEAWAAITVAIIIQSLPFLVLGVLVSALITALAPGEFLRRVTPGNPFLDVPVSSVAAIALPGCECASVPVTRSLMRQGLSPAASLAFMMASPSLNPVVIVSTAVAFYSLPAMAWARFIASLAAVVIAGWLWLIWGNNSLIRGAATDERHGGRCSLSSPTASKWTVFQQEALHDLTQAGGFLVIGAMVAGLVKVLIPATWFIQLSSQPVLVIAIMALFAIVLSLCSEADAFVAASFTAVSPTAQLVFLVVGPVVDIKLISMQVGAFGRAFTLRFLPLVFASAFGSAVVVGLLFFGTF